MDTSQNKNYVTSLSNKLISDLTKEQITKLIDILSQYLIHGHDNENAELLVLDCDEKSTRSFGDSKKFNKDININVLNVPMKNLCNEDNEMYRIKITANKIINRQCGFDLNESKDIWNDDCLRNMSNTFIPRSSKSIKKVFSDEDNETCSSKLSSSDMITSQNYNNTYNNQSKLPNQFTGRKDINTSYINIDMKRNHKSLPSIQNSGEFYSNSRDKCTFDNNKNNSLLCRKKSLFSSINRNRHVLTTPNNSVETHNNLGSLSWSMNQKKMKDNDETETQVSSHRRLRHETVEQLPPYGIKSSRSNCFTRPDSINYLQSNLRCKKSKNLTNKCNICHFQFSAAKTMSFHNCKTQFHI